MRAQPLHKLWRRSGPRPATSGAGGILPCRSASQSQKDGHPSPPRTSTVPGLARLTGLQRGRRRVQTPQGVPRPPPPSRPSACCHGVPATGKAGGAQGLRDSAGTGIGPGDTGGLFAQRTCAKDLRILRTRARKRALRANVLVLSEAARARAGGRRSGGHTRDGGGRPAPRRRRTTHAEPPRPKLSSRREASKGAETETRGTFSPERSDRRHSGGSVCQAEGTRRRGRPPRRAKQRCPGASGAALSGGTQLKHKAEPDTECPGGSAVLL